MLSARRLYALGLVSLLAFSACTKAGETTAEGGRSNAWTTPHVLSMADGSGDINSLNPHLATFQNVFYMAEMTMAWLVKWDEHNNPIPELATEVPTRANGGVSADGLTITYHLRKGVKWSDGVPFDADDVVFSTKAVLNPANNEVGRIGWDQIVKIDEPDKYTVVYHLKKPFSGFVETFFSTAGANPCVLPKHILGNLPNINNAPYNALPVGIGPFKFQSWQRSEQVVMVANPLYFRGRPKLDKVVMKLIPDRNTMLSLVQAHSIDMWFLVPGKYLAAVTAVPGYSIIRQPSYFYNHYDFNLTRPAVKDLVVRQALRYALDRQELRHKIAHDVGIVQDVTTPINAPYAVKDLGVTPFDLDKANALLDGAGWVRGPDGIRSKNGVKLLLDLATISGSADQDQAIELIRSNWKKIGVDLSVHHYPAAVMFAPMQDGGIIYSPNKWDVVAVALGNDAIGDLSAPYSCGSFPPNGQNDPRWCNKRAEAAMQAVFGQFDQADRNKSVHVVEEELVKDVPTIVTAIREDIFAFNSDLKNWHPNAISPFDSMMDVDI
ncbi:MAG TPA: peptide ABC transporter substrate-binding protein [Candidatus Acidoferrales bacterium]|jgi:peptide/nickel transport system substrate-binding protein|nr:peptide ABC transporter substrate-binding protein [Candidatus Acidoferrales bacterium]